MSGTVIDTNVLIVANGGHTRASLDCFERCISALTEARNDVILVDDGYRIFDQYRRHCSHAGQPGVGRAFFKWLWDNQGQATFCRQVAIEHIGPESTDFAEFPRDPALSSFDPSDRMFVAVARGSAMNPIILNATDTDWWTARQVLARNGVRVEFLCPELMG